MRRPTRVHLRGSDLKLIRLIRQAREIAEVPRDLLLGRYPPFVTGGDLPAGQVPVFVLHGVTPERFARQLDHLARNEYRTLTGDELIDVIEEREPAPQRAVALTFDDGRGSVWSVAAPLMRRRGMRGTVFLVPGRMRDAAPGPSWNDVEAGRSSADEVLGRELRDGAFMHWSEVTSLAQEGLFEFDSHTLTHARIHTGPEVEGFLTPSLRRGAAAMDVPLIRDAEGNDLLAAEVALGTPLLVSAARVSEARRFLEEPGGRRAATDIVAREGEAFFERPDWERRLSAVTARALPGRHESAAEQEEAIRTELTDARRQIEARTGRPAHHFCDPWHAAGPTTRRLAMEAGHVGAFCGKVRGTPITLPGGDPRAVARVGEDFVELLPGAGRGRIAQVLARKWRRRVMGRA